MHLDSCAVYGCVEAFCLSPPSARRRVGVGGGGDIEKSRADREIITWKGAATEYPALTDRHADRQAVVGAYRMQSFTVSVERKSGWDSVNKPTRTNLS